MEKCYSNSNNKHNILSVQTTNAITTRHNQISMQTGYESQVVAPQRTVEDLKGEEGSSCWQKHPRKFAVFAMFLFEAAAATFI